MWVISSFFVYSTCVYFMPTVSLDLGIKKGEKIPTKVSVTLRSNNGSTWIHLRVRIFHLSLDKVKGSYTVECGTLYSFNQHKFLQHLKCARYRTHG